MTLTTRARRAGAVAVCVTFAVLAAPQLPARASTTSAPPPVLNLISRVTAGAVSTGPSPTAPQVSVAVGAATYTAGGPVLTSACPALWLLVLDDTTLLPVFDDYGTHGLVIPLCNNSGPANVVNTIGRIPPTDLVVVNTLPNYYFPRTSVTVPYLGSLLSMLGLGNPPGVNLATVDLGATTVTGVGYRGLTVGSAFSQVQPLTNDMVPGGVHATPGAVRVQLLANNDGNYTMVNTDAQQVRTYGGIVGGWSVAGVSWPAGWYTPTASLPPNGGGFLLLMVGTAGGTPATGSALTVIRRDTFWTNTGDPVQDAAAYTRLAAALTAEDRPGVTLFLRTVGAAKRALTTAATDPSMRLAAAFQAVGAPEDVVTGLAGAAQLTMVVPGTGQLNRPPAQRTTPLPVVISSLLHAGQDPDYVTVLMRRAHNGFYFSPAQVTPVSSDADQPDVLPLLVGQSAQAWPDQATPALAAAYTAWSQLLCGCADARAAVLYGTNPSSWWVTIDDTAYTTNPAFSATDWTTVGRQLVEEFGWMQNIRDYFTNGVRVVQQTLFGTTGSALLTAWQAVKASLLTQQNIDLSTDLRSVHYADAAAAVLGAAAGGLAADKLGDVLTPDPAAPERFSAQWWREQVSLREGVTDQFGTWPGRYETLTGIAVVALFTTEEFTYPQREMPSFDANHYADQHTDLTVATLGEDLNQALNQRWDDTVALQDSILSDYGKVSTMGQALASAQPGTPWYYSPLTVDAGAVADMTAQFEAGFYRLLLGSVYQVQQWPDVPGALSFAGQFPAGTSLAVPSPVLATASPPPAGSDGWTWVSGLTQAGTSPTATKMSPPTTALMQAMSAVGVSAVDVMRTWPLVHQYTSGTVLPY